MDARVWRPVSSAVKRAINRCLTRNLGCTISPPAFRDLQFVFLPSIFTRHPGAGRSKELQHAANLLTSNPEVHCTRFVRDNLALLSLPLAMSLRR